MKDDVHDTGNLLLHRLLRDGIMLPLLKSGQQFLSLDRRLAHRPFQYATFCLRR